MKLKSFVGNILMCRAAINTILKLINPVTISNIMIIQISFDQIKLLYA